jgi:DNA-binding NarL/FixJ family response regulator
MSKHPNFADMTGKHMFRVAVFDDNREQRDGLQAMLAMVPDMVCVGTFTSGRDAVAAVNDLAAEVVLMDINMPGTDGITATAQLRARFPQLLIIMRTVMEDDERIFSAIKAGADGYFLKHTPPDQLVEGIRNALEGGAPMTPSIARRVLRMVEGRPAANNEFDLSQRELEVLSLLVKGHTYKRIAQDLCISYPTVNKHVSNVYAKLRVHCVGEAVAVALRKGLV